MDIKVKAEDNIIEQDGLPMPARMWAIISTMLAIGMSCLDLNIVNVALPSLAKDFGISPNTAIWIVNAYQLSIVVTLLAFSSLGDIIGFRKIYLGGIIAFMFASILCVFSRNFTTLVIARAVQGLGASALTSVNQGQLRTIYPSKHLGRGMGLNAMAVSFSGVAGPSVASAILATASWQWLFAINIPISIAAFIMGHKFLPKAEYKIKAKFDKIGAIANAMFFGLLIYSIEGFAHHEKIHLIVLQLVALVFVTIFYWHYEHYRKYPLLPIDLLHIPILSTSVIVSICGFTAQMLGMVSLPFLFQNGLHYSMVETGLLLTAWPLTVLFVAPIVGILVEHIHPGILGSIGLCMLAVGMLLTAQIKPGDSPFDIVWRLMLCGGGFTTFQTPNNNIIVTASPINRGGAASGMIGTARLLGQTLGTTLVAFVFGLIASESVGGVACLYVSMGFALLGVLISPWRVGMVWKRNSI